MSAKQKKRLQNAIDALIGSYKKFPEIINIGKKILNIIFFCLIHFECNNLY